MLLQYPHSMDLPRFSWFYPDFTAHARRPWCRRVFRTFRIFSDASRFHNLVCILQPHISHACTLSMPINISERLAIILRVWALGVANRLYQLASWCPGQCCPGYHLLLFAWLQHIVVLCCVVLAVSEGGACSFDAEVWIRTYRFIYSQHATPIFYLCPLNNVMSTNITSSSLNVQCVLIRKTN